MLIVRAPLVPGQKKCASIKNEIFLFSEFNPLFKARVQYLKGIQYLLIKLLMPEFKGSVWLNLSHSSNLSHTVTVLYQSLYFTVYTFYN